MKKPWPILREALITAIIAWAIFALILAIIQTRCFLVTFPESWPGALGGFTGGLLVGFFKKRE